MSMRFVVPLSLCMLFQFSAFSFAQSAPTPLDGHYTITYGLQSGLGLAGTLGAGGRFVLSGEHGLYAAGLGFSFLASERNIFVPSLRQQALVSGVVIFTEIVGKVMHFDPLQLQGAVGMAVVRREGRVKGMPVIMAMQGPYIGMDVRYSIGPSWFGFVGTRITALQQATLTITGKREIIQVSTVPALVLGMVWEI